MKTDWGLNQKQLRFCELYSTDHRGTEAARQAGYRSKPSVIATVLLNNEKIQRYLVHLKERIAEQNNITQDYFIRNLKEIAETKVEKTSDRLGAFKLLAQITGHLKEQPSDNRQVVILKQHGYHEDTEIAVGEIPNDIPPVVAIPSPDIPDSTPQIPDHSEPEPKSKVVVLRKKK